MEMALKGILRSQLQKQWHSLKPQKEDNIRKRLKQVLPRVKPRIGKTEANLQDTRTVAYLNEVEFQSYYGVIFMIWPTF